MNVRSRVRIRVVLVATGVLSAGSGCDGVVGSPSQRLIDIDETLDSLGSSNVPCEEVLLLCNEAEQICGTSQSSQCASLLDRCQANLDTYCVGVVLDAGVEPDASVDTCVAISSNASWEVCVSSSTHCEAVFENSVSCDSLCAAAGLECVKSYENVDGACAPDLTRAELPCDGSANHGSDYCVCGTVAAAVCGDGTCDGGESCETCEADCGACADCTAISSNTSWEVCESSLTHCEAVFQNSVSCDSLCAAAGLECVKSYENVEGACAPDLTRAELPCDGSANHGSDYCVCGVSDGGVSDGGVAACGDGTCDASESCTTCESDCGACPAPQGGKEELLSRRIGFGRNAGSGSLSWPDVVVTNRNDSGSGSLRAALSSGQRWITFSAGLSGTISVGSTLSVPSNVVIDGRGADITLSSGSSTTTMRLQSVQNIIVTNLKFQGGEDGIFIRNGSRDIWLDHLTLGRAADEVFAFTGAGENSSQRPDMITVSWTYVHQAGKVMLLSSTETNINNAPDRVTLHHNYWSESVERHPLVRFSRVHAFNNWLYHWGSSSGGQGVRVGNSAQYYSEANIYDDAYGRPGLVAENLGTYGYTKSVNDLVTGNPQMEERQPSRVFTPSSHYSYTPDVANQTLRDRLSEGAGWQR